MTAAHQALARARGLVTIRRWREAMDALAPALAAEATAAEAHCLRAQCHLELGQPREAAAAARQALAVEPDSNWAHRLLAIAYLRTRRRRAARAEAAEAVRLAPQQVHALHVLAVCQIALNHRVAAEQTARLAVAASPHEPLAHLTLAKAAAARRDVATAERAYREGLRLAPDNPDLALGLGQLMHRLRRKDEAADAYLAAARSDPADGRARRALARLGLPVAGAGVAGVVKIAIVIGALHTLTGSGTAGPPPAPHPPRLVAVAVVIGALLLFLGVVGTALRVRGTRSLPDTVRQGLKADHRNAALGWVRIAAFMALLLAILATTIPRSAGGGPYVALGFAAFAAAAAYTAHRLWTGPRRGLADIARTIGNRLSPGRR